MEVISAIRGQAFPYVFVNKAIMAWFMWRNTRLDPAGAKEILGRAQEH
jgi:hypothetical protein